jgi:glutamate racemase
VLDNLAIRDLGSAREDEGDYRFLTTGDTELFQQLGERFLQLPLDGVEHVKIAELEAAAA